MGTMNIKEKIVSVGLGHIEFFSYFNRQKSECPTGHCTLPHMVDIYIIEFSEKIP
jgi:hypothetical protein